jgi:hypothetical protein
VTQKRIEQELLELERRYWQAMLDKDTEAAMKLTDESCIVAGAQGVAAIDRKTLSGMMTEGNWTLEEFEIGEDAQVRMLSDDVAVVAYTVREELTVDGKPVSLEAADASTWVRRDGRWVCALHTEALTGDPFGRDRKASKA